MIIGKHGITLYFGNKSDTYLASVLSDHFKFTEINQENWNRSRNSLRNKSKY